MEEVKEPKVIIAMKGLPCTGKTTLASVLAKTLKLSIFKLDDLLCFRKFYQKAAAADVPGPSSSPANGVSYQEIFRILPKQLQLRSKLIFDSPLSEETHFQQLRKVAHDSDAALVIVECKPEDAYTWAKWFAQKEKNTYESLTWQDLKELAAANNNQDYDVGDTLKLTVNTTGYVKDVAIAHAVMQLSRCSYGHRLDFHDWATTQFAPPEGEIMSSGEKSGDPEDHLHVLTCCDAGEGGIECKGCLNPIISNPAYKCSCLKIWLHKSCAEVPSSSQKMRTLRHRDLPFLKSSTGKYCFPETYRCGSCEESNKQFSDGCIQCLFQTIVRCRLLPTVVNHSCRDEGSLFLAIFRLTDGFEYTCLYCKETGKHVGYVCRKCFYVIHVQCALLPLKVKYKNDIHDLELTPPQEIDNNYEFSCDICEERRNPAHWRYYCKKCDVAVDMDCAVNLLPASS